ncbi:MAG TPA: nuclear transport factor 2 family protein [Polyangiaceae bacterium]|nr:nuclear transport factor 2 family protein [Polyangiaceae bacterium]
MTKVDLLNITKQYLLAVQEGATGDRLAAFYTSDAQQEEFPNRLIPTGAQRDLAAVLAGAERGQALMASQTYELVNSIIEGNRVAIEVLWTGTLRSAVPGFPAVMKARFGMFIEFEGTRIRRQHNYDCFEPW